MARIAWKLASAAALAVLLGSGPVLAHHSYAAFDRTKEATISGVVDELEWTNPHVWIFIWAPPPGGGAPVRWGFEGGGIGGMTRAGWSKNTIHPGEKITITHNPMRDGSHGGGFLKAVLENGKTVGDT